MNLGYLDALPFYVLLVDSDHCIVYANKAVQKEFGVDPARIIGGYCPKVVHGVDGVFPGCPLEESVETGEGVEREVFDQKTGHWLRSAIYPTDGQTEQGKRIFFHMVTDITESKQVEEQLRASHDRIQGLAAHLETVREEERKRIARDLHDETSQTLASLAASLEAVASVLPADATEVRDRLRKLKSLSVGILDEINKLIYELRPTLLDDLGLVAAARWLAESNLRASGVAVNFRTTGRGRRQPSPMETMLFRVIQEAISNIARHADAKNVNVSLHFRKSAVRVDIRDDGRGFDVEEAISSKHRPRGLGLLGMKERVELFNGSFTIRSRLGEGTDLTFTVPKAGPCLGKVAYHNNQIGAKNTRHVRG